MRILLLSLILFISGQVIAQKQYAFNSPGNTCYYKYLKYAPNNDYSGNKPIIIALSKENETLEQTFAKDFLKTIPEFNNYLIYYIPNKGGTSHDKLKCIEAHISKATGHFKFGKHNLFLKINDPDINQEDIVSSGLNLIFAKILLASKNTETENTDVAIAFKKSNTAKSKTEKKHEFYDGPPQTYDYTLAGMIKDAQTGEALPFASVQLKGTSLGSSTNMDGYFTLHDVPTDTSTISISYIGYAATELKLTPQMSKSNLIIDIEPNSTILEEATVTTEREEIMQINTKEISTITMTPKNLEQLPNMGEKDIMRSFQLMPGISSSNESSSGLYVRGGTPDQNLIVYDGFTIYHVDHLYGFFSAFNSNAIKDVQLYKGGFESRFGGRLSSVTEITGKDGNQKDINIGGEISLLSFNAFAEIPIGKKFSSIMTFRRSYKGFIYNTIFDQFNEDNSQETPTISGGSGGGGGGGGGKMSVEETKLSSYFYDLNGKFTFKPNDKDIISLSIFNGTDHLDNGYEMDTPQRLADMGIDFDMKINDLTNYGNFASGLRWSRKWNQKLYSNTVVSYSNYYSDRVQSKERNITTSSGDSNNFSSGSTEDNNLKDLSIKSDLQWDVSNNLQMKFGAFETNYDIDYNFVQNDTVTILNKHDYGNLAGAYAQAKLNMFDDKFTILPGVRADYFDVTDEVYIEPRLSMTYSITDKVVAKGAWGEYKQFANRVEREDISSGSRDFWVLSNGDNIPISSAEHYILGLSYETPKYLFNIEGYYKNLEGLSEYSLRFDVGREGVTYEENFFNGAGYAKGLEFLAQRKFGKVKGWLSYTLGEVKNQFDIYGSDYFFASQDVSHEFKAVALYSHKRWNFSATWIYATGRPYTAPSGAYTIALVDGTTQDYFSLTRKNGLRLPDYHRFDISANYKLYNGGSSSNYGNNKKKEIGNIGFSIFNVYNRTNTWYKQYEIVEGEIIETNVNYLGFMPNITLSLKLR